jgi:hypothetical protein
MKAISTSETSLGSQLTTRHLYIYMYLFIYIDILFVPRLLLYIFVIIITVVIYIYVYLYISCSEAVITVPVSLDHTIWVREAHVKILPHGWRDYERGLDLWIDLLDSLTYSTWLHFTTPCYTHTLLSTVTCLLPLLGSGFQRRMFPFPCAPGQSTIVLAPLHWSPCFFSCDSQLWTELNCYWISHNKTSAWIACGLTPRSFLWCRTSLKNHPWYQLNKKVKPFLLKDMEGYSVVKRRGSHVI